MPWTYIIQHSIQSINTNLIIINKPIDFNSIPLASNVYITNRPKFPLPIGNFSLFDNSIQKVGAIKFTQRRLKMSLTAEDKYAADFHNLKIFDCSYEFLQNGPDFWENSFLNSRENFFRENC